MKYLDDSLTEHDLPQKTSIVTSRPEKHIQIQQRVELEDVGRVVHLQTLRTNGA